MPPATGAEAVELDTRTDDFAAIQSVPRNRSLMHGDVHDLVTGNAPEMRVFLGRSVEPGRRVAQIDGLDKPDVHERLDRLVDCGDAHPGKLAYDARVDVIRRRVRRVPVKKCVDRKPLSGDSITGTSKPITGRRHSQVCRMRVVHCSLKVK